MHPARAKHSRSISHGAIVRPLRVPWASVTLIGTVMVAPAIARSADPVKDLASKIFVELVCRNVVVTDSAAQINSNPENLARISFKLAEAFQRVDVELKAPSLPKNQEFDMKAANLPGFGEQK
jgi:hypothetical protein